MAAPVDDCFGLLVAYEVFALASGRCPPVTVLCRRRRWLSLPVCAVIAAHLLRPVVQLATDT